MTTQSLASYEELLYILFEGGDIVESMNKNAKFYSLLKRRGKVKNYGGREIRRGNRFQRMEGVGFVPNNPSSLPQATVTDQIEPSFTVKNMYGVGEIDDMLLEDARSSKHAYRESLDDLKSSLLRSVTQNISATLYGDGRGVMGELPAADDGDLVLNVSYPNYLREGQRLDLIDDTDDTTKLWDSAVVDDVDFQASQQVVTFTGVSALSGSAEGDYFVLEDSLGNAWFGLQAAVNDSNPPLANYGGLDRTSVSKRWQSLIETNPAGAGTNRPISERLILDTLNLQRRRHSGMLEDFVFLFPWDIASEYWEELVTDRQITVANAEVLKLLGGFEGATKESMDEVGRFAGTIPMHADEKAPSNIWWGLCMPELCLYQTHDPELVQPEGQGPLHRLDDRGAYQWRYLYRAQLVLWDPASCFAIKDVAHS